MTALAAIVLAQADAVPGASLEATSGAAEFWVFWLLAPLSLAAAVSVVLLKNPVHAALMLVVNFFTFAVFYAVLQAQFLATIQIIVYAGAIMILFLFVLMLLGVDRNAEAGPGRLRGQKLAAVLLGMAVFLALTGAVAGPYMGTDSACNVSDAVVEAQAEAGGDARPCVGLAAQNAADGGNVAQIGRLVFGPYVWPFEVTSVLLVIAAIGAMVLGRRTETLSELVDRGEAAAPGIPHTPELEEGAAAVGVPTSGTDDPNAEESA